jgi:hypothetical protein
MSRLWTDNEDQMPITASVYGPKPRVNKQKPRKDRTPRGHSFPIAEKWPQ